MQQRQPSALGFATHAHASQRTAAKTKFIRKRCPPCHLPPLEFTCWRKPTLSYGIIYNSSKHYLIWGGEQEKNAFAQREMNYKSHHFEDAAQVKPTLAFCSSLTALPSDREFSVCFQYHSAKLIGQVSPGTCTTDTTISCAKHTQAGKSITYKHIPGILNELLT